AIALDRGETLRRLPSTGHRTMHRAREARASIVAGSCPGPLLYSPAWPLISTSMDRRVTTNLASDTQITDDTAVQQTWVVGTAGHVDHGKSTLVKALTGIDPDRLREEREREMTIDLGFAWLQLPGGMTVSVVDVPGHERFIKNM